MSLDCNLQLPVRRSIPRLFLSVWFSGSVTAGIHTKRICIIYKHHFNKQEHNSIVMLLFAMSLMICRSISFFTFSESAEQNNMHGLLFGDTCTEFYKACKSLALLPHRDWLCPVIESSAKSRRLYEGHLKPWALKAMGNAKINHVIRGTSSVVVEYYIQV